MVKRRGKVVDRCRPLRDQLKQVGQEISNVEKSLDDPKIPESTKQRLRALLIRLKGLERRLQRELKRCEAIPVNPLRK